MTAKKPLMDTTPSSTTSMSSLSSSVRIDVNSLGLKHAEDLSIGMPSSDSTARLVSVTPTDECQDSRETLLSGVKKETGRTIFIQVVGPFLVAGLGMVMAGVMLDVVAKEWTVFKEIPEFLVLVTPLLGLKGNLEMTLASRLSTQANLGNLDVEKKGKWKICICNICLIQVQAIVVGFLSSLVAMVIGLVLPGEEKVFSKRNALLLCASSLSTASIASLFLGGLMIAVVIGSRKVNINPDNIATPIAASLGDLVTLGILSLVAKLLYSKDETGMVSAAIIVVFIIILPTMLNVACKNEMTKTVLQTGWTPVIGAMLISSVGGLILDKAEQRYSALALYQPVINGVGGNLASIQTSRISTHLHRECAKAQLPQGSLNVWGTPWDVFLKRGVDSTAARVLLMIVIPGHCVFLTATYFISNDAQNSAFFILFYLMAALIQVGLLLYCCDILTRWLWMHNIDPDLSGIPYITALGDLTGTSLLFIVFVSTSLLGHYQP